MWAKLNREDAASSGLSKVSRTSPLWKPMRTKQRSTHGQVQSDLFSHFPLRGHVSFFSGKTSPYKLPAVHHTAMTRRWLRPSRSKDPRVTNASHKLDVTTKCSRVVQLRFCSHTISQGSNLLSNSKDMARWTPIPQKVNWELSLGFASVYGRGKASATKPRPWEEV
jgi:hypothetical protein